MAITLIDKIKQKSGDFKLVDAVDVSLDGTEQNSVKDALDNLSGAQKNADITKAEIEAKLTGTISSHGHTIPVATTSDNGLMSKEDKVKLDNTGEFSGITKSEVESVLTGTISSHDHDIATTTVPGYMAAADRTKLENIADNANNYTHPANHPASIITQDSTNRFVTDTEKSTWSGKADDVLVTISTKGLMSPEDKTKLDTLVAGGSTGVGGSDYSMHY